MKVATARDYRPIKAIILACKKELNPCPSPVTLLGLLRKKQILYDKGVVIIFKQRPDPFIMAGYQVPACTELKVLVSKYRGRGYAKAALQEFFDEYGTVYLNVFKNNIPANRLYVAMNMTLLGSHTWNVGEVNYYVYYPDKS